MKLQHSTNKLFLDKNDHSLKGIPVHNKEKNIQLHKFLKTNNIDENITNNLLNLIFKCLF